MSDEQTGGERTFRPSLDAAAKVEKERAFSNALSQRKMVLNTLADGTLSCLPGADGFADTKPAVNMVNGTNYHGANMLYLKDHQKQNGFPTAEYVTENQIENAKKDNPDLAVPNNEKGVYIHWQQKNEQTGDWENQHTKLFNVAQINNPDQMREWSEQKQQEKIQNDLEYMKTKYGPNYQPPEPKQKGPGPVIECTSTDPEKYLGQYLAAVSMGGKFKASEEQSREFSQKMENSLLELKENGYSDPFKLSKISNAASIYCKDVIREANMSANREQYQQEKLEQTQSRGRGI